MQRRQTTARSTIIFVVFLINFINITYAKTSETEPLTYYASPTGNGSDCTQDFPCDFFSIIETFAANHTSQQVMIQLLPGEYKERVIIKNFSNLTIISTTKNNLDVIFTYSSVLLDTLIALMNSHVTFDSVQFSELDETIISVAKGSVTCNSCTFLNNTKKKPTSGGLLINSDEFSPVIIRNTTISGNTLTTDSPLLTDDINGFLILSYSTIEIYDSEIHTNTVNGNISYYRGLVYSELNMTIANSIFSNNQIRGMYQVIEGGAIFSKIGVNIFNSTFSTSMISPVRKFLDGPENIIVSGGSIYSLKSTIISSSAFSNNYIMINEYLGAQGYGGAIFSVGELFIETSNFTYNFVNIDASQQPSNSPYKFSNHTEAVGGAIFGSVISIQDTIFVENSCTVDTLSDNEIYIYGYGGAISGDKITVNNGVFTSNSVRAGMNGNFASSSEVSGGAIASDQVSISQTYFRNNQAFHSGGAVYVTAYIDGAQESSIQNSTFSANYASGNVMSEGGGAIYMYSPPIIFNQPGLLIVNSSSFFANEGVYGSDIFLINTQPEIIDTDYVVVYNYDNYYDSGSTTPSLSPSFSPRPSSSPINIKSGSDIDIWWTIIVCVISAVFILIVIIAIIGVVFVYLRRKREQHYTSNSIQVEIEERDDHFD